MPSETLQPTSVTLGAGWSGAVASIDEGASSHNGDVDYISSPGGQVSPYYSYGTLVVNFADPTITPPYTKVTIRVVFRAVLPLSLANSLLSARLEIGGAELNYDDNNGYTPPCGTPNSPGYYGAWNSQQGYVLRQASLSGSFSQSDGNSIRVILSRNDCGNATGFISPELRITAIEAVVENSSATGNESLSWSESVVFGDVWTVAGDGASTSQSWAETVTFADTWALTSSGGGGTGDIDTGRTDIACRTCGTIVQVTESLIFYADGQAAPITWDGASATATDVSNAPLLPWPAAFREKVFLYGELPYVTGTVKTVSGVTQVQFSTAPATTTLGKGISISGVTFGTSESCQATITVLNGVLATLSQAPNQNFDAANFIIFGGSGGSQLRWSADNDHTTWTDSALPVGRLDGDLSTGAFVLGNFLILTKRSHTYRFDYDIDPNDESQRALSLIAETRGLVANRSAIVIEGTAYMMDAQPNYFWVTRGGALFPLDIGRPISNLLQPGGDYEPDWSKSSCWFGWYSPISKSICWAFTKSGDSYPRYAAEYFAPNIEGGDEPGRWSIREYHHYILGAVNATGEDGVSRPYLVCADRDDPDSMFLAADSNSYGDMATSSTTGTVTKQISTTVLELPKHTAFHAGSLIEINGQTRTVTADDTVQVTVSLGWTVEVVGKKFRAGYRPRCSFKTIDVSPEPGFGRVSLDQIHCIYHAPNSDAELIIGLFSDGNTEWLPVLAGAGTSAGDFQKTDRLATIAASVTGYEVSFQLTLLSPGGSDTDAVYSVDCVRSKRIDPPQGWPSEP